MDENRSILWECMRASTWKEYTNWEPPFFIGRIMIQYELLTIYSHFFVECQNNIFTRSNTMTLRYTLHYSGVINLPFLEFFKNEFQFNVLKFLKRSYHQRNQLSSLYVWTSFKSECSHEIRYACFVKKSQLFFRLFYQVQVELDYQLD